MLLHSSDGVATTPSRVLSLLQSEASLMVFPSQLPRLSGTALHRQSAYQPACLYFLPFLQVDPGITSHNLACFLS